MRVPIGVSRPRSPNLPEQSERKTGRHRLRCQIRRNATVPREIARMLKPGGRMAISDIVTERQLTEAIVCDVNLWASCIGGAMQENDYRRAIAEGGLELLRVQDNPQYHFISDSAQGATETFGVKSVSVLATKPTQEA